MMSVLNQFLHNNINLLDSHREGSLIPDRKSRFFLWFSLRNSLFLCIFHGNLHTKNDIFSIFHHTLSIDLWFICYPRPFWSTPNENNAYNKSPRLLHIVHKLHIYDLSILPISKQVQLLLAEVRVIYQRTWDLWQERQGWLRREPMSIQPKLCYCKITHENNTIHFLGS